MIVYHNLCICRYPVTCDLTYSFVAEESQSVCSNLPTLLYMTFAQTSPVKGSLSNVLFCVAVSFVTGCTTPFATSSSLRGVSFTFKVCLLLSTNVQLVNWCNAVAAMSAVQELTVLLILCYLLFGLGTSFSMVLSCAMMSAAFTFGYDMV